MNVREALIALDALFVDQTKWTKGSFGRDSGGIPICAFDEIPACSCWCLSGGISKVTGCRPLENLAFKVQRHMEKMLVIDKRFHKPGMWYHSVVSEFNDDPSTDFARVKEFISACIAAC